MTTSTTVAPREHTDTPASARPHPPVSPAYSVREHDDRFTVSVQLPGVRKDAIEISVEDHVLTLKARRSTATPEGWRPLYRETSGRDYELSLRLPRDLDEERFSAACNDGILNLDLFKAAAAQPRAISIS